MYPSANSDNPFEFLLKRSLFHCDHQSPSSNQNYNDPHFLPNFPSPFFDEHELPLNQILSQTQPMSGIGNHNTNILRTDSTKDKTPEKSSTMSPNLIEKSADHHQKPLIKRRNLGAIPRKRTGKKDRHSKICTAQGIRDRRMRLSLQVARKFFDLQDMLGYDKASKTIEWLFTNSKHAIKELIDNEGKSTESIISEYEGVSGIEETSNMNVEKTPNRIEMRDKARARARSRTKEKMMVMMMNTKHDGDVKKIGSSSNNPFESTIVDQESSSINNQEKVDIYPSFDQSSQFDDVGTIEKLLQGSLSSSASCSILGNWDLSDIDQVSLGGNPSSNLSVTADFPLFHQ